MLPHVVLTNTDPSVLKEARWTFILIALFCFANRECKVRSRTDGLIRRLSPATAACSPDTTVVLLHNTPNFIATAAPVPKALVLHGFTHFRQKSNTQKGSSKEPGGMREASGLCAAALLDAPLSARSLDNAVINMAQKTGGKSDVYHLVMFISPHERRTGPSLPCRDA